MSDESAIVVLITAPSQPVGEQIARMLVEKKLAACVNLLPAIHSIYAWEGKIEQEQETLLIVKTRLSLFQEQFVPAVQQIHPYKVPEIIALPVVDGLSSYLQWIDQETRFEPKARKRVS